MNFFKLLINFFKNLFKKKKKLFPILTYRFEELSGDRIPTIGAYSNFKVVSGDIIQTNGFHNYGVELANNGILQADGNVPQPIKKMSIVAWIKPLVSNRTTNIFQLGSTLTPNQMRAIISSSGYFRFYGSFVEPNQFIYNSNPVELPPTAEENNWYMVVLTVDATVNPSIWRCCVNSPAYETGIYSPLGNDTGIFGTFDKSEFLKIGPDVNTIHDDLMFFDDFLTEEQCNYLYNNGLGREY